MQILDILDISLARANEFYTWGWRLSIIGAVVTALGVGLLMWGTRVRDHDFKFRMTALNKEAADARLETAQLSAIVAGRQLTSQNIQDITNDLKGYAGRNLYVASYSGDAEAARLGLQIKAALEGAGVRVYNALGATLAGLGGGGVDFGVHISGPDADHDFMLAIRKSLETRGKIDVAKAFLEPKVRVDDNLIGIMVALRPLSETTAAHALVHDEGN